MSVLREVDGEPAAVTWWVDDVAMIEQERIEQRTLGPDPARTSRQFFTMYVFDELIQNRDRNQGNILWTSDWKMWVIDHTRAFRQDVELTRPERMTRIERRLLEGLRGLFEMSQFWQKRQLAKGSPADPDRLYLGQWTDWFGQVIQRSDDGGQTWKPVGKHFAYEGAVGTHLWYDGTPHPWEFKRVWHLEPSPSDPDTVYAGVEDALGQCGARSVPVTPPSARAGASRSPPGTPSPTRPAPSPVHAG